MELRKCAVGPETLRMLKLGHPWVVADSYTRRWPVGKTGDLVALTDESGRFLATALLDPEERIVARVLAREKISLNREWLERRFRQAHQLRHRYAALDDTTAFRLVNGEGDGIPGLVVDRYGDYLLMQVYCNGWRPYLKEVTAILQHLFEPRGIYEKERPRQTRELEAASETKRYGRLVAGVPAPERLEVQENGLNFLVTLEQGLNTGLFLDQRKNRRDFMGRVRGKRVLNLFAHTAAFSVAAAAAGATLVTSVDASPSYTEWGKANFGVNRLNPRRHEFIVGDCFEAVQELIRQKKMYDVVIMDPPSFSTTAKTRFTTRRGTAELVAGVLPLLLEGGLLVGSSNHQKVSIDEYLKELRRGALQKGDELRVISVTSQPEDFPYPVTFLEGGYLKYVLSIKGM